MSSSSMSFQPGNSAMYRPSKPIRANNPFGSQPSYVQTHPLPSQTHTDSAFLSTTTNPIVQPGKTTPAASHLADKGKDKKASVGPLGFLFPVMTLIGTPIMLVTSLLGINKNPQGDLALNPNWLSKKMLGLGKNQQGELAFKSTFLTQKLEGLTATEAKKALQEKLLSSYKIGRLVLALGILPKTLIGIMYGIQSQQPSMLLAHLLQLPLTPMILKEKKTATTLVYLMGGLFTLGFINDIQNGHIKEGLPGSENEKIRLYDMTHFKQAFQRHSGLSLGERVSCFFSESGKMLKFSAEDHVISSKRAMKELNKLVHGDKNELTDLRTTGSISKSSLGFMLSYAATIPALAAAMMIRNEQKAGKGLVEGISKYSMATTLLSGIMLNFGMMLVALNGKNWAERVPMVGTSMELSGTVMGYSPNSIIQPFAVALQQLGSGLNSIFYAHQAQKD